MVGPKPRVDGIEVLRDSVKILQQHINKWYFTVLP
jgi:hypothetical protein